LLEDVEGTEFEFPLERVSNEIHGATDGRLELLLDAKTLVIDETQEIIGYFRKRLKESYGKSLFHFIFISHLIEKRLTGFEETKLQSFFKPLTFPKARLIIPTIFPPQIQSLSINPEVREILKKDEHSRIIIDNVLLEIQEIPELKDENYYINVSLEQDIEVPDWKEIVVSVQVEGRDYDDKMRLWEAIEERVRTKIEHIRDKYPAKERKIIDRINENLAIEIEETF
jgi:hypothetical protein